LGSGKKNLKYIKDTQNIAISFLKLPSNFVNAFSSADWTGCLDDRGSIGGLAIFLGLNVVSWSVGKQTIVSQSFIKPEYKSLAKLN
jgi:hypothetical protein